MLIIPMWVRVLFVAGAVVASLAGAVTPARAEIGDVSVGGVWVCRLTRGTAGLTLDQRMRQIEQRITEVLSSPGVRQATLRVEVRPIGAGAAIVAAGVTIMTVTPDDAADTRVPTPEVANQWAARLAQGLRRALPGRTVVAQMHVPQTSPRPGQPGNGGSIIGVTWHWRGTLMGDDSGFMPADPRRYTLQFSPDGRVAVRADCNTGLGTYALRGRALTVTVLGMTKAACESGSLDRRFLDGLRETSGYLVRDGDLILMLKYDSGTMRFSRAPGL